MNKQILKLRMFFLALFLIIMSGAVYAEVTGVTITGVVPPSPGAGDSVTVNFTYSNSNTWNGNHFLAAVSTFSTFQSGNTTGQTFKVASGGINIGGTGDGWAADSGGGYNMSDGSAVAAKSGSFTFNIPTTAEGGTYYIIVGGRQDWVDTGGAMPASQDSYAFTVPMPPPSCSLTLSAEGSTVQPGDYILYTIDYTFINGTNLIISDVIPPDCTLVEQSLGGTSSGTTAGSTLSWVLGDSLTGRVNGTVWFLVQVGLGVTPGSTITNNTQWVIDEIPAGGDSNDASVDVNPPFELLKSQSSASLNQGDTITYSFDFDISGLSLKDYDSMDTGTSADYFATGGTWTDVITATGGYIKSPAQGSYPHYLKNDPSNFCTGMIIADAWIGDEYTAGADNWDALVVFRDNGLAGAAGRAYGFGISSDGNPSNIYLQEVNPAYAVRANSNAITVSSQRWYTLKILISDAGSGQVNIKGKAWPKGTVEPATWQIDWTDTDGSIPACGYVGFQGHASNPNLYDDMKVLQPALEAYDAVLYDTVPAEIQYLGGTAADGTHLGATHTGGSPTGGIVSWTLPGQVDTYSAHLEWWGEFVGCGTIYNTGQIMPNGSSIPVDSNTTTVNVTCPGPTNTFTETPTMTQTETPTDTPTMTYTHTPTETETPIPAPNIVLNKSVSPGKASPGDTIMYSIRYMNNGTSNAANVNIWDSLASQLQFVDGGSVLNMPNYVAWPIGSIPNDSTWYGPVTFTAILLDTVNNEDRISNFAFANDDVVPGIFTSNNAQVEADVPELDVEIVTNYPNPLVDDTVIVFNLSVRADVTIKFFTVSGELVRTMDKDEVNAEMIGAPYPHAGENRVHWEAKNDSENSLSSGIYIYKIIAKTDDEEKGVFSKLAIMR